jgi:hypothetical protein
MGRRPLVSHSVKDDDGNRASFHSDLSGDVRCVLADGSACDVPGDLMKRVVAHWAMRVRVARLEQMTDHEILTGKPDGLPR